MSDATFAILASALLAGLAGSLHCVGMCGPILAGFSAAFPSRPVELTIDPALRGRKMRMRIAWDFAAYHAGRIWTYALLGLLSGIFGHWLRAGSAWLGWQQVAAGALSLMVIFSGVALLGFVPGRAKRAGAAESVWARRIKNLPVIQGFRTLLGALVRARGLTPRLLLGAVMGFLPCGLVYAMLALAAMLPSPWLSAASMAVFGVGTLPGLTAVLLVVHAVPLRFRIYGPRLAAVLLIATGSWMFARSLTAAPDCCDLQESSHVHAAPLR